MSCSKRMRGCHANCQHRAMVEDYQWARVNWEEARESAENMLLTDEEYREKYPPPLFKQWLEDNRGKNAAPEPD